MLKYQIKKLLLTVDIIDISELQNNQNIDCELWFDVDEFPVYISNSGNEKIDRKISSVVGGSTPAPSYVMEVSSCYLTGSSAVGVTNGGSIILDSVGGNRDYFVYRISDYLGDDAHLVTGYKLKSDIKNTPEISETHIFNLVPPYNNFYAWIIEYLPKLRMLEYYEEQTGTEPHVLIKNNPPNFVIESLEILGYDSRILEWPGGNWRVENLILSNHRLNTAEANRRYGYNFSLKDLLWLRERMLEQIPCDGENNHFDRVYISRQKTTRGVVNFSKLEKVLKKWNFEIIDFEDIPLKRQIEISTNANILMGPHGAGLVHSIFGENTSVVELFSEIHVKPTYYVLSSLFGLDYHPIISDFNKSGIVVEIEELENLLDDLCKNKHE